MKVGQLKWSVLIAVSACTGISTGNTPVAIEFVNPPVCGCIQAGQTDTLHVRALDRSGDSVGAAIRLLSLNPDTLSVDSVNLTVTGVLDTTRTYPVTGRVVATAGNLQSLPLSITVTAP